MPSTIKTIFVDLGGVFLHPESSHQFTTSTGSTVTLRRLMSTATWADYETDKLTDEQCFQQLADTYDFPVTDLSTYIDKFRKTTTYEAKTASIFQSIKQTSQARIFLASNISNPDYNALRDRWDDGFWSIFDGVYTSAQIGARKPSPCFFRHVLHASRSDPQTTFFVDDRPENILSAVSVGMRGTAELGGLARTLANVLGDPVERGLEFLRRQGGRFETVSPEGDVLEENYGPLLVLEALKDRYIPRGYTSTPWCQD